MSTPGIILLIVAILLCIVAVSLLLMQAHSVKLMKRDMQNRIIIRIQFCKAAAKILREVARHRFGGRH